MSPRKDWYGEQYSDTDDSEETDRNNHAQLLLSNNKSSRWGLFPTTSASFNNKTKIAFIAFTILVFQVFLSTIIIVGIGGIRFGGDIRGGDKLQQGNSQSIKHHGHDDALPIINVLMGLSGDEPSFFAEVEVALKSLLLNAPLDSVLHIHFMADQRAYDEMIHTLENLDIQTWKTRNQIKIFIHNVEPFINKWTKRIEKLWHDYDGRKDFRHTIGSYFRLFSHKVLPQDVVKHAIYMDSDVVILADLQDLWMNFDDNKIFQWGTISRCAGFMLFNVPKLVDLWKYIDKMNFGNMTLPKNERPGDQAILRAVEDNIPGVSGTIPRQWDINAADGCISCRGHNFRSAKSEEEILLDVPTGAGMLHLNGGKKGVAYYNTTRGLMKYNHTFGLVRYYSDMPWSWAKYIVESKVRKYNTVEDHNVRIVVTTKDKQERMK